MSSCLSDDSLYESPEPFLTDDTSDGCLLTRPRLFLLLVMLVSLLFTLLLAS